MIEIRDCYFKDAGEHTAFISGLPIPTDPDGVCRNRRFVNCDFHPCCEAIKFQGCEFINCNGDEYLTKL